ncbi:MAG: hypothetical protein MZV64_16885 [Ignavibacteriales bacterium]|nr:hypothetical protein [Ignavibacteriales bacterium]
MSHDAKARGDPPAPPVGIRGAPCRNFDQRAPTATTPRFWFSGSQDRRTW